VNRNVVERIIFGEIGFLQMHELLDTFLELLLFAKVLLNFLVNANNDHELNAKKHSIDHKYDIRHVLEVEVQVVEL
jgi:hypothetical protein